MQTTTHTMYGIRKSHVIFIMVFLLVKSLLLAQEVPSSETPDPNLVAVGSLSASNLYFSYLVLSTMGDSLENKDYDLQTIRNVIEETIFFNKTTRDALQNVINTDSLNKEDKELLQEMIYVYRLIDNMAKSLIRIIDKEDDGKSYEVFREEAWSRILILLSM